MTPDATTNYLDKLSQFTDKLVDLYNRDYKSGDHGTPEDQFRRYLALAGIADLDYASILDAGCGVGLFYDFLLEQLDSFQYIGVDVSPRAVRVAIEYQPTIDFRQGNLLEFSLEEPVDFVIANGLLYIRNGETDLIAYRNQLLIHLFSLCGKGLAINFPSTRTPYKDENNYLYFDPGETLNACLLISPNVVLRHDYEENNFTVYLYK
jgi:SAM-dependent methyltransferase